MSLLCYDGFPFIENIIFKFLICIFVHTTPQCHTQNIIVKSLLQQKNVFFLFIKEVEITVGHFRCLPAIAILN